MDYHRLGRLCKYMKLLRLLYEQPPSSHISLQQDLSKFVDMHPGGVYVLLEVAGKDATEAFFAMHRSEVLVKYGRYIIGTIEKEKPKYILPTPGALSPVPYG